MKSRCRRALRSVVPEGLANTLANAMSKDALAWAPPRVRPARPAGSAGVRQDRYHRGPPLLRLCGLHQSLRGGQLHLRRFDYAHGFVFVPAAPLRRGRLVRRQRAGAHLVHRDEADRHQLWRCEIAADRPTLRRRLTRFTGASVAGLDVDGPASASRSGLPGRRSNQLGQQQRKIWRGGRNIPSAKRFGFGRHHPDQQRHPPARRRPCSRKVDLVVDRPRRSDRRSSKFPACRPSRFRYWRPAAATASVGAQEGVRGGTQAATARVDPLSFRHRQ